MNPKRAYRFCPRCAQQISADPVKKNLLTCKSCNFHLYINPVPTNGVIIENKKGEILLVKRGIEPKKGWWDVPGGFIEPGETLTQSVEREVKEELGVVVKMDKIIGVYPDTYLYQRILESTLTIAVSAHIVQGEIKPADDVVDYKFFNKEDSLKQKIAFVAIRSGLAAYLGRKKPRS